MVVVKLKGGLGNQLFQYAAGRCLAERNNDTLKLDLTYPNASDRPYELKHFYIRAEIADPRDLPHSRRRRYLDKPPSRFRIGQPRRWTAQKGSGFSTHFYDLTGDIFLDGYWQSEKFFEPISTLIRRDLQINHPPEGESIRDLLEIAAGGDSISVHVRRGDYVSSPETRRFHGLCNQEYFQQAVELLSERVSEPHVLIFSDDPEWTRANLSFRFPTTFASESNNDAHEELRVMSVCKHHVISNSSFSWWGAWLSESENVIAPATWFADPTQDETDTVPSSWIKLQNSRPE